MSASRFLSTKAKKPAIFLSYVSLALSTLSSIFLTPILLKLLGEDNYGLYQMVYSVASYIMILDMGISTVMVTYMSQYRVKGDRDGERNIAAIVAIIASVVAAIIFVFCLIIRSKIGVIYKTLTPDEVSTSQKMIMIMSIQFILTIVSHYQRGAIQSREYFVYSSSAGIFNIIFVFVVTVSFALCGFGCVGIALANLIAVTVTVIIDAVMLYGFIGFRPKFKYWDKVIVKPVAGLMVAMLLQSIIGHVNTFVDKTLLGIYCQKADVTVYSLAATILTMFNTLPGVISGLFQPQVTKMVVKKASTADLTDVVISVGRWQFMLLGAVLGAFVLFGRDFITIWAGESYSLTAWLIAIIIMIPNIVPLIQSVCISILNAYNKRIYRSLILISMTGINILLSIMLIKKFGPLGAPIGTALSYIVGNGIALNVYYSKGIHLEVKRMFSSILKRTWLIIIAATVICLPLVILIKQVSVISFLFECSVFVLVYGGMILLFGMNKSEKSIVDGIFKKFLHFVKK